MDNDKYEEAVDMLREAGEDQLPVDFPKELLSDRDFVIYAIKSYMVGTITLFMDDNFKDDIDLAKFAVVAAGESLANFSDSIRDNKEVVLLALNSNSYAFNFVSDKLKEDYDVVLGAVTKNGYILKEVKDCYKDDEGIARVAVLSNTSALKFISERLIKDRAFVLDLIKQKGSVLNMGCAYYFGEPDIPAFLEMKYHEDREIVLAAVSNVGRALEAAPKFNNDKEIVLLSVAHPSSSPMGEESPLEYASKELKEDKEVVAEANRHSAAAIKWMGDSLYKDKEFVLELIKENPKAYSYLIEAGYYEGDKDIALAAVRGEPYCLADLPSNLLDDEDIIIAALKSEKAYDLDFIMERASARIQNDPKMQLLLLQLEKGK